MGGAGSGIGRATAARLAADGLRVVLLGRTERTLTETARDLAGPVPTRGPAGAAPVVERAGAWVDVLVGDVAAPGDAVLAAVAEADVLVLNAGGPRPGRILDVGDADWHRGLDLLLLGPLRLARAALPAMAARGFGRVVFVTSTAVRKPEPDLAVSVVVRSAVTAAAKLLSLEHAAAGVTVNCVAPGATATARRDEVLTARAGAAGIDPAELAAAEAAAVPAGRAGAPAEVAAAIAYLASEQAGYVNGTVLTVDGGRTEAIW